MTGETSETKLIVTQAIKEKYKIATLLKADVCTCNKLNLKELKPVGGMYCIYITNPHSGQKYSRQRPHVPSKPEIPWRDSQF